MSDQQFSPVSFQICWDLGKESSLYIGDNSHGPPASSPQANAYWYIVVSSLDLSIVFNEVTVDNANYPSGLDAYLGSSEYYVFISTRNLAANHLPVGSLYSLLEKLGATSNLTKVLQIANQLGTGGLPTGLATYSIAANTDLTGNTAFDQYSFFDSDVVLVPLKFGAVTVAGKTVWVLGQLT